MKLKRVLLAPALGVLLAFGVLEVATRLLGPAVLGIDRGTLVRLHRSFGQNRDLPGIRYRPYPYVNYVPQENPDDPVGPRDWGFDLPDEPGRLRIACLGGSTTAGIYPAALQEELDRRLEGRALTGQVDVMNWGVSGWCSQESLINYMICVSEYEPDIVVFMHAVNDVPPRFSKNLRMDLAHHRKGWDVPRAHWLDRLGRYSVLYLWLRLRTGKQPYRLDDVVNRPYQGRYSNWDGLVPADFFRRNVQDLATLVRSHGGELVLMTQPSSPSRAESVLRWSRGLDEHNGILREVAAERDLLLVEQAGHFAAMEGAGDGHFIDLVHLDPEGQKLEAAYLAEVLLDRGLLR